MGTCSTTYIHSKPLSRNNFSYDNLMKCPEGHPLAFFQSSICQQCKGRFSKAVINCISCEFGLCQKCFDQRFENWKKTISHQDRTIIQNLIIGIKQGNSENEEAVIEAERLKTYIISKFQEDKDMRTEGCPILRQSIKVRTEMVKNYLLLRSKSV